LKAKKA